MSLFKRNIQSELMSPPDAAAGDAKPNLSSQDIFAELMKDDTEEETIPLDDKDKKDKGKEPDAKASKTDEEETTEEKDDKEEDEEAEEEDELKALEDELEEPDEDKLELTTPTSRREILKKYPKLFKEFPYLETAYYREQAFTKILPTIADAKEAVDKAQTYDNFEKDLSDGNTGVVLQAIKEANPKAFNKVVDDYLPTLAKVDKDAYHHVIGNLIRHTIMGMIDEARSSSNEQLEQAAVILNQYAFGSSKFTPPTKLSGDEKAEPDDKEQKISQREKQLIQQKFNTASEDVSTKVSRAYKVTIEKQIDPKQSMTEYVRRSAVREAVEDLEAIIQKDSRFKTLVDKLWDNAFKNDFDNESVLKIKKAFVSKAQTLLPSIIQKHRNAALKGMGKRVSDNIDSKDEDSRQSDESKKSNDSRSRRESKGEESHRRNDSSKKVPDGMTSLEYLMAED